MTREGRRARRGRRGILELSCSLFAPGFRLG